MHEFSVAMNILNVCVKSAEQNNAKEIKEVFISLGDFTLIVEDMLEQCFNIASKGSIAETAKLNMTRTPGSLYCNDCSQTSEIWFEIEKEKEEDAAEENKSTDIYEEGISAASGASGYKFLGANLFQCKHCGSKNTELKGGKEIKILNIKVSD
jgi:hydrogenase nickel incorporation protein HypA/HybF